MTKADQALADLQKGINYNGYNVNQDWRLLEGIQDPGTTGGMYHSNTYNVYYNSKDPTQNFSTAWGDNALYDQLQKLSYNSGLVTNDQLKNGYFQGDLSKIDPNIINTPTKVEQKRMADLSAQIQSGQITAAQANQILASGGPSNTPAPYVAPTVTHNQAPTAGGAEDIAKYGQPNNQTNSAPQSTNSQYPAPGQTVGDLFTNPYTNQTFNWKTGALVYDPKTQTGSQTTQNTSQGAQSTSFALSSGNLKYGSSGDDVKKLQQYLQGLGIYQGKIDGIFGPQTQQSVQQFQSAHGLAADGIVGPKTVSAIQSAQGGQGFPNTKPQDNTPTGPTGIKLPDDPSNQYNTATGQLNPNYNPNASSSPTYNTGDPALDATLKELQDFIKTQQDAGLKINQALNFDQATLNKFLETAKAQVHPFYAQQIEGVQKELQKNAGLATDEYGNEIANQQQNFQQNLGTARENFAGSGLAFSGQRAKDELGMQDSQNRNLASLSSAYGSKLGDYATTAEKSLGTSGLNGFQLPTLNNYSTSLSGNGALTSNGTVNTGYTPGTYKIGTLTNDEEAAIEARNQALKKSASESVVAGRSYQDLFA